MNASQQLIEQQRKVRSWIERAVLAFVLLTLATLVAVPILVNRRVTSLREDIQDSEPARTLVNRLQFNLVREMGALTEVLLTGDEDSSDRYAAARAEEDSIYRELAPITEGLGQEVEDQFHDVHMRAARWHARAADEDVFEDRAAEPADTPVPRERMLFEDLLRATTALDAAILRATTRTRDEISGAERSGLQLTFVLGILALVAGAAAAVLAGRARRFARESELRGAEAEAALEETARATRTRERLLRGITHDVKNPLGAARGYAEILALGIKAPILPEQAPLVAGVKRSIDSALDIIADLLDVARADSGGLSVNRKETDLATVAASAVDDQRAVAEAAGHALELEPLDGEVRVYTDPTRVRQVLHNLLSNAVKYTPAPGRITVHVGAVDGDGGPRPGKWAAVRVADTGPGIRPEERERIFDEFTRLDDRAGAMGHGLGLAIARRIARLLGGDLSVEDADGPGSTFVLWLPLSEDAVANAS